MVTTDIEICSKALGQIRETGISSFNDGTNAADICDLYYENFANDILTRYPWSFATKKRLLNQDATAPLNEYKYAHIVPAEVLRLWALFSSSAVGAQPITDYDIQMGADGRRRIHSNYETLYGEYTVYVDEANWPPYFITFAYKAFAAVIAMPVTDQVDVEAKMKINAWGQESEKEQGGAYAVATLIDAQQKPGEVINSSPLIDARFS